MELNAYISLLDKNTGDVMELLKECSEVQIEQKRGEEWSILEILEHLLITDHVVYELLLKPSEKQSETAEIFGHERMKRGMIDLRDRKATAPEKLLPKGDLKNESEFVEKFLKQRAFLVNALENGSIVMDHGIVKHSFLGDLTKRDWMSFIIYHTERHLLQIQDRFK